MSLRWRWRMFNRVTRWCRSGRAGESPIKEMPFHLFKPHIKRSIRHFNWKTLTQMSARSHIIVVAVSILFFFFLSLKYYAVFIFIVLIYYKLELINFFYRFWSFYWPWIPRLLPLGFLPFRLILMEEVSLYQSEDNLSLLLSGKKLFSYFFKNSYDTRWL